MFHCALFYSPKFWAKDAAKGELVVMYMSRALLLTSLQLRRFSVLALVTDDWYYNKLLQQMV
jgi:hypothetical protein